MVVSALPGQCGPLGRALNLLSRVDIPISAKQARTELSQADILTCDVMVETRKLIMSSTKERLRSKAASPEYSPCELLKGDASGRSRTMQE